MTLEQAGLNLLAYYKPNISDFSFVSFCNDVEENLEQIAINVALDKIPHIYGDNIHLASRIWLSHTNADRHKIMESLVIRWIIKKE